MGKYYKYRPLSQGEIRLLRLLPSDTEEVYIQIFHKPLIECIDEYEALSYTWGDPEPAKEVFLNESKVTITYSAEGVFVTKKTTCKALTVTPNLYDALKINRVDRPRTFWIDQITINQGDLEERKAQVELMGQIFKGARHVIIWLGLDVWQATNYVDDLQSFHDVIAEVDFLAYDIGTDYDRQAEREEGVQKIPASIWRSIEALFTNSYFQRVWIIQEVIKAKKAFVQIGDNWVLWEAVERIGNFISQGSFSTDALSPELRAYTRPLLKIVTMRARLLSEDDAREVWIQRPKWTLQGLLFKTHSARCKDPRDKVYGILGLLDYPEHCIAQEVKIDYSIDPRVLMRKVLVSGMSDHGDLTTLSYVDPGNTDRPSWIPNWDGLVTYTAEFVFDSDSYGAATCAAAVVKELPGNEHHLTFRATAIGTVTNILDYGNESRHTIGDWETFYKQSSIMVKDILSQYQQLIDFLQQAHYTLDAKPDDYLIRFWQLDMWNHNARFGAASTERQQQIIDLFTQDKEDPESVSVQALSHASRNRGNCHACLIAPAAELTSQTEPLLCWAPVGTCVGDEVFAIHGLSMPMLAYRAASGNLRLRGMAYVHGVMDGELFAGEHRDVDIVVE